MKISVTVIVCTLLFVYSSICYAGRYYMSLTGNNNNNGTSTLTPWATMQHAAPLLVAGDTLFIRGGNYTNIQYFSSARDGSAAHPIVIMAYPGERPVFTGNNNPTAQGAFGERLRFYVTHSYLDFNGLTSIRGWDLSNPSSIEVMEIYGSGAHHINITNCTFKGCPSTWLETTQYVGRVLFIREGASYITMDQDSFLYAGEALNHHPSNPADAQNEGATLGILNACHHIVIKNSYVGLGPHDVVFIATAFGRPNHHIIIRNSILDSAGPGGANDWGGGYGVDIVNFTVATDTSTANYIVIENNIFYPPWKSYRMKCGFLSMGMSSVTFRKNLIYDSGNHGISIESCGSNYYNHYQAITHNFIYNNTVVNSGINGIHVRAVPEGTGVNPNTMLYDNLFANNIFLNGHQHQCWPAGTPCEDAEAWLNRGHLVNVWMRNCTPPMWTDYNTWGRNIFKNNLISQLNPSGEPYAGIFTPNTNNGIWSVLYTDPTALAAALPGVFIGNKFQADPQFSQLDRARATLSYNSPCVDAGIKNINQLDAVVAHLLTTSDSTWARANGLDTLVWHGYAPDMGAFESDFSHSGPPSPVQGVMAHPPKTP